MCNIFRCPGEKRGFKKSISIAKLCNIRKLQRKEHAGKKGAILFKHVCILLQHLSWKQLPEACHGKEQNVSSSGLLAFCENLLCNLFAAASSKTEAQQSSWAGSAGSTRLPLGCVCAFWSSCTVTQGCSHTWQPLLPQTHFQGWH